MTSDRNQTPQRADKVVRIRIRNGVDLQLDGPPEQRVRSGPPIHHVALVGADYPGLKARLRVAEGDRVTPGQALFIDKRDPVVQFTAPGAGKVVAVNRGARRTLARVVIRLDEDDPTSACYQPSPARPLDTLDRRTIVSRLAQSGLWTAFRTRPFNRVPPSEQEPVAIFVTAMDTQPLAADPSVIISDNPGSFRAGLQVMTRLTEGTVWLCTAPGWPFGECDFPRLRRAEFTGPHPAGLAGTHIHTLESVGEKHVVWHASYQDVMAIGRLFSEGVLDFSRVVSVAGAQASQPGLVRTRSGASMKELLVGNRSHGRTSRLVSGSPLSGRLVADEDDFLGRYHLQVSLLEAPETPPPFGWLSWRFKRTPRDTAVALGQPSGMLPLEVFDRLLPDGFLVAPLLRAMMTGDIEQSRSLGCMELDEEDLALCAWACPAYCDYGGALRSVLQRIEKEG